MREIRTAAALHDVVHRIIDDTPVLDIHTHLYSEAFGERLLRGPEALLCYHYLQAETNRLLTDRSPAELVALDHPEQARLIWKTLFVERSPLSEATRGVITAWNRLGVPDVRDYDGALAHFAGISAAEHIDRVFEIANVAGVIMTNDPFDPVERETWQSTRQTDIRFHAALRIDALLVNWPATCPHMQTMGYQVRADLPASTYAELRRFLYEWIDLIHPVYMAASLPWTFSAPDDTITGRILEGIVLPICRERDLALAMMVGTKRRMLPDLGDAGDGMGRCDLSAVTYLCRKYPANKFLLTVLARDNQHEAVVLARKFRNLHLFGCWWFNNNPSIIEEVTRERVEMLGLSMTPQHSDARILDQLPYKWAHSRKILADVLCEKYAYLIAEGWLPTEEEIRRDVALWFGGAFTDFIGRPLPAN
jgi:hypothetical protein